MVYRMFFMDSTTFVRTTFVRMRHLSEFFGDICQKRHLSEWTFVRNDICQNETFVRNDICQNETFVRNDICQNMRHLSEYETFVRIPANFIYGI